MHLTAFVFLAMVSFLPAAAFAQVSSVRIPGVQEPPELTGEPKKKKFTPPSDDFRQVFEAFPKDEKDTEKVKAGRQAFTKLLQEHPDYSDGYFMRAMLDRCMLNSGDTQAILQDINTAISTHAAQKFPGSFESLGGHYSLRAKIQFDTRHYRQAMDDLEIAMLQKIDDADSIFDSSGPDPNATSPNACIWKLPDLDRLVQMFPKDYRAVLLRGLYYRFFVRFNVKYFSSAIDNLRHAIAVNPKSALSYYLLGSAHSEAVFWPSLLGIPQEQSYKSAIQAYDRALELDPKLSPAFLRRASAHYQLKHYQQAIKDFDKVIELEPNNSGAYHDRALVKINLEKYHDAISDLTEALEKWKPDGNNSDLLYEHRADAYVKVGNYRDAIADFSKAIERQLANLTFLLSLQQIRGLYPEYNAVPDEALCRKINALFWPEFEYSVIKKSLLENNGEWTIGLIYQLYEKRGDAYLRTNDFRRGVLDFSRIFKGIPNFAGSVDRWRLLGISPGGDESYLNVKSVEFADSDLSRLWMKTVTKNGPDTVQAYEIDCKTRRINLTSNVVYNWDHQVLTSSEVSSGWQRVVPESIGEQLYNGACSERPLTAVHAR